MTPERVVLTGFPRQATEDDYALAAEELEGLLTELPGAVALYRFGSVTAPGISDLDRLVVVEDCRDVPDVWSGLSGQARYVAMHSPVLTDSATFTRHRWFAELGEAELVWGQSLSVNPRPVPEYSEPLLAAEALVVRKLKLAKLAVTRRAKVRPLLCELWNLRLDLHLARIERAQAPRAWRLVDEVDRLRNKWWSLGEAARRSGIQQLLVLAPDAIREAIVAVGNRVDAFEPPPTLRLRGAWRNVMVAPGDPSNGRAPALLNVIGHTRRLGEARWRWLPRQIALPPGVISLLVGPPPREYADFRAERNELVHRHADSLASCPGYSGLSLAPVFLQR